MTALCLLQVSQKQIPLFKSLKYPLWKTSCVQKLALSVLLFHFFAFVWTGHTLESGNHSYSSWNQVHTLFGTGSVSVSYQPWSVSSSGKGATCTCILKNGNLGKRSSFVTIFCVLYMSLTFNCSAVFVFFSCQTMSLLGCQAHFNPLQSVCSIPWLSCFRLLYKHLRTSFLLSDLTSVSWWLP